MNDLIISFLQLQRKFLVNTVLNIGMFFLFINCATAGTTSNTIQFKARFIPGSCDISVYPQSINWGTVLTTDIKQAGENGTQPKKFTVNYTNCSGYGVSPKLSITGNVFTAGVPLFSDTSAVISSDSIGYGIRLVHEDKMNTSLNNHDVIPVGQLNTSLVSLNGTGSNFYASISCGNNCNSATLRNGILSANVIFTFLYE